MIYVYRCPIHGDIEEDFPMGQALAAVACCSLMAARRFTVPHFTEDRRRFGGEGISAATGRPRAQSRAEERAVAKELGIEFMTRDEVPPHLHNAREYGRHLKAGKAALPPAVAASLMSPPPEPQPTILEALRKSGKRLGEIPSDRPMAGRALPAFPTDVTS